MELEYPEAEDEEDEYATDGDNLPTRWIKDQLKKIGFIKRPFLVSSRD